LLYPVHVPGALFSGGDLHFSHGDGEITLCGASEMGGFIDFRIDLIKGGMETYGVMTNPILMPGASNRATPNSSQLPRSSTSTYGPLPRGQCESTGEVTPREKEVFVLVATGYSNTEIASQLYIGDETVKTHVSRILSKLGLRDRVHAVVYAHHHGLVP
jgi:DNA-binding CsgD family transcriptional regulator